MNEKNLTETGPVQHPEEDEDLKNFDAAVKLTLLRLNAVSIFFARHPELIPEFKEIQQDLKNKG
jgi:hypothetical protein